MDEIIKYTDKANCDIIIMGSHGHSGILDTVIGSISQRVVKKSRVPVLLVRLPREKS